MTNKIDKFSGWKFWLWWVLGNMFGFALGIGLSFLALPVVGEIAAVSIFGLISGLIQWFVLRKRVPISGWWILFSSLGASLSLAASNALQRAHLFDIYSDLWVFGIVLGIAGWLILRVHFRLTCIWVLANTVGWYAGGLLEIVIALGWGDFLVIAVYGIIGLINGALTGLTLALLFKYPVLPGTKKKNSFVSLAFAGILLALILAFSIWVHSVKTDLDLLTKMPELGAVPNCSDLPPLECAGSAENCAEVVAFEPVAGPGYLNNPLNGETWDDQYRSYLRRDLKILIRYAAAKIACTTKDWDFRDFEPLELADMSEADGAIPGTSTGNPGHPPGTHTGGHDIDLAYYQIKAPDLWLKAENGSSDNGGNLLRPICKYTVFGLNVFHCTQPSHLLDPWRTALFIAYLSEHPNIRVIGVDGQVGRILDAALDQLVHAGWINPDLRAGIPLFYEETNQGWGWYLHHHHHIHISIDAP